MVLADVRKGLFEYRAGRSCRREGWRREGEAGNGGHQREFCGDAGGEWAFDLSTTEGKNGAHVGGSVGPGENWWRW